MKTKNTSPTEWNFIKVKPSMKGAPCITQIQQTEYNIWIPSDNPIISPQSICIFLPGSRHNFPDFFASTGHIVSFPEEAIFILKCHHLEPFCTIPALCTNRWISITDANGYNAMLHTLNKIKETSNQQDASKNARLLALLNMFIIYVSRQYSLQKSQTEFTEQCRIVEKFIHLLNLQDCARLAVKRLAVELEMSPDHINLIIRGKLGFTATQLIQHSLLKKAKHAAINSDESMKEIAFRLGFNDMSHFSKFFRAKAGMTFTDFKNAFQNI